MLHHQRSDGYPLSLAHPGFSQAPELCCQRHPHHCRKSCTVTLLRTLACPTSLCLVTAMVPTGSFTSSLINRNQFFCWAGSAVGPDLPSWKWECLVFRPAKELPGLRISDPGSCGQGQRSLPTSGAWLPTSSTRPWTAPSKYSQRWEELSSWGLSPWARQICFYSLQVQVACVGSLYVMN